MDARYGKVKKRARMHTYAYLDAAEAWVAGESGGDPGPERRQVDRRGEAEHGHDVAAEVRLPEQPPRRAHRLLLGHGIGTDPLVIRPAARRLAPELDRRRGRRVYGQRPLPQRGAGTGAGIHRPRRVSSISCARASFPDGGRAGNSSCVRGRARGTQVCAAASGVRAGEVGKGDHARARLRLARRASF